MKWLSLLYITFCSVAWALDPGTQNIIDEYLRPFKGKTETSDSQIKKRVQGLQESYEEMSLETHGFEDRIKTNQPTINQVHENFKKIITFASPYENPRWREFMVEKLSQDCCKMKEDPNFYDKILKGIDAGYERTVELVNKKKNNQ